MKSGLYIRVICVYILGVSKGLFICNQFCNSFIIFDVVMVVDTILKF